MKKPILRTTLMNVRLALILAAAATISFSITSCEFYGHGELDDDIEIRVDGHDGHHDGHHRR